MCRRREEEGARVRELRSGAGLLSLDPVLRQCAKGRQWPSTKP